VKAGAIEAASSINGQIMPPVMGAAAFLMVEYVGIPYSEIVKHAILPAVASYLALLYIVHLEAVKIGSKPIARKASPARTRLLRLGIGISGSIIVLAVLYYGVLGAQAAFGANAPWILAVAGIATYLFALWFAARVPDLTLDDPNTPITELPGTWEVTRTGLDFLIPLVVLLWCLMVEQLSPGLSAFWATVTIMAIAATRKPLLALFRRQGITPAFFEGMGDLLRGLAMGARNMIGIGIATATAGIIVGTITLTGLGLMMTELVEFISGGNVIIMLLLIAAISLVLGMGIPTTANYILVATLMAPVVVELGAQAGLAIPLIAVHLFVFYFGIMADITPPVGLASFAAAAISREDPIATGFQGAFYALRTAVLPFVFIFNPQMLLIGVENVFHAAEVIAVSLAAILLFSAATMGWFVTRSRWWETVLLLAACFCLFRPDWFLNQVSAPFDERPAAAFLDQVAATPSAGRIAFTIEGTSIEGEDVRKTVSLKLGAPRPDPKERLREAGVTMSGSPESPTIMNVGFGSYAERIGLEAGLRIASVRVENPARPSAFWVYLPALLLTGLIALNQRRRARRAES
jgi:TRAP transporter 4TM/12TM fusion protein